MLLKGAARTEVEHEIIRGSIWVKGTQGKEYREKRLQGKAGRPVWLK